MTIVNGGYYAWHGTPVTVEVYDHPKGVDVSTLMPEHETGKVPAGETHILVRLVQGGHSDGWWATEDTFMDHATPVGPEAVKEWDDE
jgi:hypothetical protein